MSTDVKAGRRDARPHRITLGVASMARTETLQNKWVQAAFITAAVFVIYFVVSNQTDPYVQYVRLADAMLHGHLYLTDAPAYLELARYRDGGAACQALEPGCKGYVIDPPAPAVLLLPFVAVFGSGVNQVLVSMMYGAIAIGLLWVATHQLGWDRKVSAAITVLAALGTNFWWATTDGSTWMFAHVSSVLFMMAALVEGTGRRRAWVVGLLLGLAGLSRLPVFLAFPFFLYLILQGDIGGWRGLVDRAVIRKVLGFGTCLGAMVAVLLLYNYARYHTVFDRGYSHPQYAHEWWFARGRFDITYIPRHVEAIFTLAPKITEDRFPFFTPSIYGMALIMVSPAFLYAFAARAKKLEIAAAVALLMVAIPHVLHGVTGWTQFGYRYSIDYFPMLLVLTASGMGYRMSTRKWLLVGLCVFIAMWGPLFFFDTRLEEWLGYQWKT